MFPRDDMSRDAAKHRHEFRNWYVYAPRGYVGSVNATYAQMARSMPHSELTNGCRVHVWATPKQFI